MRPALSAALFALVASACSPPSSTPTDGALGAPQILGIDAPSPVLPGSVLRVRSTLLDAVRGVRLSCGGVSRELLRVQPEDLAAVSARVTADDVTSVGAGPRRCDVVLLGTPASAPVSTELTFADALVPELSAVPRGDVHRNDDAIVRGAGLLAPGEGTVRAHVVGTFTPTGGAPTPLDVRLDVLPAERFARDRGLVRLGTTLGGPRPGTLDGTLTLEAERLDGSRASSSSLPLSLRFLPPELFAFDPAVASLGRIVTVRGAGFLGGSPDETTLVRIEGTFTPAGGAATPFARTDLVPRFVSGAEVTFELEPALVSGALVSRTFGAARGVFRGTATPLTLAGREEVAGAAVPFELTLGPLVQVVELRFLPGFYDALVRFGLGASAGQIEARIAARIDALYEGISLDVRTTRATDFAPGAVTTVELGGADPNGAGLFGYDNTPGKDVGNLRLGDEIGGANAATQSDGQPGYGGVFLLSLLYWSSHPELPGSRPPGAPSAEPQFNLLFDGVRARPATLAELRGEGPRAAEVQRALDALVHIASETTAHELGHSLGLALPDGPRTAFHDPSDEPGCLMDPGNARPFAERAQLPGAAPSRFCHDAPAYLRRILPVD